MKNKFIFTIVLLISSLNISSAKDINPVNSKSNTELNQLIQSNIKWDTYSWMGGVRAPEIEFRVNDTGGLDYKYLKLLLVRFSKNEKLCADALDATVPFPEKFRNNTYTFTCELNTAFTTKDFKTIVKERQKYLKTIKKTIEANRDKTFRDPTGIVINFKIDKFGKVFEIEPGLGARDNQSYQACKQAIEKSSPFEAPELNAFSKRFVAERNYVPITLLCK